MNWVEILLMIIGGFFAASAFAAAVAVLIWQLTLEDDDGY